MLFIFKVRDCLIHADHLRRLIYTWQRKSGDIDSGSHLTRAWLVVIGLLVFSWNAATNQPNALFVAIFTALAWVMFLEDYMVLDGVLFIVDHPLAQLVIITRPIFLVALTYVAFKQWEVDLA